MRRVTARPFASIARMHPNRSDVSLTRIRRILSEGEGVAAPMGRNECDADGPPWRRANLALRRTAFIVRLRCFLTNTAP